LEDNAMFPRQTIFRSISLALLVLLCAGTGSAVPLSYVGAFNQDDAVQYLFFNVAAPGTVTIQTWSFGGGTNSAGQVIPDGGFAPVLTLILPDGTVATSDFGLFGCGNCNPDPSLGYGDAYINVPLPEAGQYIVALTEYDNLPGSTLSDGFSRSGQGNFTAEFANPYDPNPPQAPFLDYWGDGAKRTGSWAVDISGDEVMTPEPASVALVAVGLVLLFAPRRFSLRRLPRV